jgi:hypothetical protein
MTDALARLVRRTLRPETVLQPRLASPFERRVPGAGGAWVELGEAPAEAASPPMERRPDADAAAIANAGADLVVPPVQPQPLPRPSELAEPPTRPHSTVRVAEPEPAPAARGLARPARVAMSWSDGPDRAPERMSARIAAATGPGRVLPLVPPPPAPARSDDRAIQPPQMRPLASQRDPDADGQAEPVIHITIGRVEVRANVAPGPAPQPDPGPPAARRVMPLEEYLERRARGGGA